MKVLVTGLFTQAGLFAVRRFGEMGFEVTAADNHLLAYGAYSKWVTRRVQLPSLRKSPELYAEALISELERGKYDYYFPSFEEAYLMSQYRDRIYRCTRTVLPHHKELMRLHDKASLGDVVRAAGVKYPESFTPNNMWEAEEYCKSVDYPVYIKMRKSRNSQGLRLVEEPSQIMTAYRDVIDRNDLAEDELPIIQRRINGPEVALSELAQSGRTIGDTLHMGIRSIPRSGGTTTARKTVDNPECVKASRKIIEHIGWTGFISIDFMIDEVTNEIFAIDCNPRPSVCINVGYYGGVDLLPEWLKIANGQRAEELPALIPEVKSATDFADVFWLLETFYKGPESWSDRREMRKQWWADRKGMAYDIWSSKDIKPSLILYLFLMVQMIKLIFTKHEAPNLFLYYNSYVEPEREEVRMLKAGGQRAAEESGLHGL